MIDDIQDDDEEDSQIVDVHQNKIKWYLIDTERNFCKAWDFLITILTIYNLVVTPMILIFPSIYQLCVFPEGIEPTAEETALCIGGEYKSVTSNQKNLINIEFAIDLIYTIEICFCFIKVTMTH